MASLLLFKVGVLRSHLRTTRGERAHSFSAHDLDRAAYLRDIGGGAILRCAVSVFALDGHGLAAAVARNVGGGTEIRVLCASPPSRLRKPAFTFDR